MSDVSTSQPATLPFPGSQPTGHYSEFGPRTTLASLNLAEFWSHRRILYHLFWRDISVRYKQTLLGATWAIVQPVVLMFVFTVFIGRFAGASSGDLPYSVFVFAGLLPWTMFSAGLSRSANSIVGAEGLISKVYFHRLILPAATLGPPLADFFVAIGVLFGLMAWHGIAPTWNLLLMPIPIALLILAAMGGGALLSALNVYYRDFRYIIPFLVQVLMFATPTIYMNAMPVSSSTAVVATEAPRLTNETRMVASYMGGPTGAAAYTALSDSKARELASAPPVAGHAGSLSHAPNIAKVIMVANPLSAVIAFFRATVLGTPLPWAGLGVAASIIGVGFVLACWQFRRLEDAFDDVI